MSDQAVPVGGPLWTRPFKVLVFIALIGGVLTLWRFAVGLGPSTGLSDGYPWGIWIAFDVVTATALACGGYAMAILVYILNKGRYHPLMRSAILTSALGYSLAGLAIAIDVGRPWFMWRIPISVTKWNLNSALLEVALCVMAYVVVLWIEMAPVFLEKWKDSKKEGLRNFAEKVTPILNKSLIWIVALGVLLPTMHQSSLGTLMLLAGHKLHRLWHTPLIPLLFLISCIAMGYAVMVFESTWASRMFKRKAETGMMASISRVMCYVLWLFVIVRIADIVIRGKIALLFGSGLLSVMFWVEMVLAILPAIMLRNHDRRMNATVQIQAAMIMILAGGLYRFDTYLVAYNPGSEWSYFPTLPELLITVGIIAFELTLYIVIVKNFPILGGTTPATARR